MLRLTADAAAGQTTALPGESAQSHADRIKAELVGGVAAPSYPRPAAEPVVSKHAAETPIRVALLGLKARMGAETVSIHCDMRNSMEPKWWAFASFGHKAEAIGHFGDTLTEALAKVKATFDAGKPDRDRRAIIAARIEKEVAEIEAAEKALSATAPLEFRPDGSPADVLPVAFDDMTHRKYEADKKHEADVEACDAHDARMEAHRRDEEEAGENEGELHDTAAD